jgi:hypothetical protein
MYFVLYSYSACRLPTDQIRAANLALQTPLTKLNSYCATSRLLSVRTFQYEIEQLVFNPIYRCKITTSRCVYRSNSWDFAWRYPELQCVFWYHIITTTY